MQTHHCMVSLILIRADCMCFGRLKSALLLWKSHESIVRVLCRDNMKYDCMLYHRRMLQNCNTTEYKLLPPKVSFS